jgi:hypothetical protein
MNEFFLHFIWRYQFFDKKLLKTTNEETIQIIQLGYPNTDQGPDFSQACLLINGMKWYGNIEIHLKASDWYLHKHQQNKNYDSVILHVVWENDRPVIREDNSLIPTLELKGKVDVTLVDKYRMFINSGLQLPCQYYLKEVPGIQMVDMVNRILVDRLERKGKEVLKLLEINEKDWQETFWQLLVRNFGLKINNEAFEQLSRAVSFKLVLKHADNRMQLEALLFGQAGFLEKPPVDSYSENLLKEYTFLAHKYALENKKMSNHLWKFLRTRPYNFPTIRIAQLAALLTIPEKLMNIIYEKRTLNEYVDFFQTKVNPYWKEHYNFGEKMKGGIPDISETTVYNILINVVIPFKMALYMGGLSGHFPEEQMELLEQLPAEINKVTKNFKNLGVKMKTGFDSQAAIELYTQYCLKRKCLYCNIGTYIVRH